MKFRKKPIVVDAIQLTWANWSDVCDFCRMGPLHDPMQPVGQMDGLKISLKIPTPEGWVMARENDWIIRGVAGELYPCRPDIFAQTYEAVDE